MKKYRRSRARTAAYLWACLALILGTESHLRTANADDPRLRIENFGRINPNYFRGGQPTAKEFLELKRMGIKTVIDLRGGGKSKEPQWVHAAGMQYFKIPLSTRRPATAEQTQHFLKLVNDPANWPVFVHCAGGRHRTGAMTAVYRITTDSWTADQAYKEMLKFDFYTIGGHGPLKDYVYSFYEKFRDALGIGKIDNR